MRRCENYPNGDKYGDRKKIIQTSRFCLVIPLKRFSLNYIISCAIVSFNSY